MMDYDDLGKIEVANGLGEAGKVKEKGYKVEDEEGLRLDELLGVDPMSVEEDDEDEDEDDDSEEDYVPQETVRDEEVLMGGGGL
eukprot:CAMPEP_0119135848 /NCGR_PEP_ID=MMETSP1310-20130426/20187_1 /TAXON_ID=464262 /ORGANISM="Genus nov. species nov., Strain RCC2339" /LENGTH=83 /DNA_ID=CAMNT_0007126793 /DNA_START=56 /DNA_END=304 /DNA_ORIENTATION=+